MLLRYLQLTSGYSRAQVNRLITQWHGNRLAAVPLVKRYRAPAAPFARKYTPLDIELLVEMDKANEDVCGPAIAHLLQRAYRVYGDTRYERLAGISVSHLYNLRKSAGYRALRVVFTKTHPACNSIGTRKAPRPDGRAGFTRVWPHSNRAPRWKLCRCLQSQKQIWRRHRKCDVRRMNCSRALQSQNAGPDRSKTTPKKHQFFRQKP